MSKRKWDIIVLSIEAGIGRTPCYASQYYDIAIDVVLVRDEGGALGSAVPHAAELPKDRLQATVADSSSSGEAVQVGLPRGWE